MATNTKTMTDPATPKGYAETGPAEAKGYAEADPATPQGYAEAGAAQACMVRVRITARCTAAGCVLAPGARVTLPQSKAEALAAMKKAIILGV